MADDGKTSAKQRRTMRYDRPTNNNTSLERHYVVTSLEAGTSNCVKDLQR